IMVQKIRRGESAIVPSYRGSEQFGGPWIMGSWGAVASNDDLSAADANGETNNRPTSTWYGITLEWDASTFEEYYTGLGRPDVLVTVGMNARPGAWINPQLSMGTTKQI